MTSSASPVTDSITTVSLSVRWTTAQQEMAEWRQPSPSARACSPPCCGAPHPQSLRVVQKCCFAAILCPAVEFQRLSRKIQVEGTGFLQRHETQVHTAKPITGAIVHFIHNNWHCLSMSDCIMSAKSTNLIASICGFFPRKSIYIFNMYQNYF